MVTYITCMSCRLHQRVVDGGLMYVRELGAFLERHPVASHDVRMLTSEAARALSGPSSPGPGAGQDAACPVH